MSSSEEDDDSSYESVAEERIGGILHEAVLEVNEEITVARPPASPPCPASLDAGGQNTRMEDTGNNFRRSSLRTVFPPFFFPGRLDTGSTSASSGGGDLSYPVHSFHLNRRRTWGSAIAHRLVMESVVPATYFRAVVAVFHLWLEGNGACGDECYNDDKEQCQSRHVASNPCGDKVASAPLEEIVSYFNFLARECGVGVAVAERNHHHHHHHETVDAHADATDLRALWHHFLPSFAEASRQTIAGKTIFRSMEDTADPMAIDIDLEACRSIKLGEWKAFLGIPREHAPSADQLADGSSDFIALLEWWNSLPQLLGETSAVEGISDEQPLYNFLAAYCRAINVSVTKYTCRGLTSSIGCVRRRRCGVILNRLGHPSSARTSFYNGTIGRLVACDLVRTYGKMKLSRFVHSVSNAPGVIEEAETKMWRDKTLDTNDATPIEDDEKQEVEGEHSSTCSEKLVDLFPSDDDEDAVSVGPKRIFRRIKRGIPVATTPPSRDGGGAVHTSISKAEKRLRCENNNEANYCEVSRAWADARNTFGVHSDEDEHDSL
jgi:hypothetical protein